MGTAVPPMEAGDGDADVGGWEERKVAAYTDFNGRAAEHPL